MATAVTIQSITESGVTPVAETAGDTTGNTFVNTGKQWIEATNGSAGALTLTLTFPFSVKGQTIPPKSFSVAAAAKVRIGPLDPAVYGKTVTFTPSATTMTVAVWQTA